MTKPCRECERPVDSKSDRCPHCGAVLPGIPLSTHWTEAPPAEKPKPPPLRLLR